MLQREGHGAAEGETGIARNVNQIGCTAHRSSRNEFGHRGLPAVFWPIESPDVFPFFSATDADNLCQPLREPCVARNGTSVPVLHFSGDLYAEM